MTEPREHASTSDCRTTNDTHLVCKGGHFLHVVEEEQRGGIAEGQAVVCLFLARGNLSSDRPHQLVDKEGVFFARHILACPPHLGVAPFRQPSLQVDRVLDVGRRRDEIGRQRLERRVELRDVVGRQQAEQGEPQQCLLVLAARQVGAAVVVKDVQQTHVPVKAHHVALPQAGQGANLENVARRRHVCAARRGILGTRHKESRLGELDLGP